MHHSECLGRLAPTLRPFMTHIANAADFQLVTEVVDAFESIALPLGSLLSNLYRSKHGFGRGLEFSFTPMLLHILKFLWFSNSISEC